MIIALEYIITYSLKKQNNTLCGKYILFFTINAKTHRFFGGKMLQISGVSVRVSEKVPPAVISSYVR